MEINNVTFSYSGENEFEENISAVSDINLTIPDGQVIVLCGESGCGKTTVTRLINGLIPHYYEGKLEGDIHVNGINVPKAQLYEVSRHVGSVFQNPRSQFFNVDTTSEVTFGCENYGMPEEYIRKRLEAVNKQFRLDGLLGRSIFDLSGGQKQKIACAGVSMVEPDIYVLDEPSSNLDIPSVWELGNIIRMWKEQGKTVVISEHRLYYLKGVADRYVYMNGGTIGRDYTASEFEALSDAERHHMGLRAFDACSMSEAVDYVISNRRNIGHAYKAKVVGFNFAYKKGKPVLHIDEGEIPANAITAIVGNNGAGKSTFARVLCGLEKKCGKLCIDGKELDAKARLDISYMVMQDVNHQLFTDSVDEEIRISMEQEDEETINEILKILDLEKVRDRHPMSLSGGQKQRVAIASALASQKKIIIFDEPTSGLDYRHMLQVSDVLKQLNNMGKSVYVITHDIELIRECCTDIIHIEHGNMCNN